MSSDKKIIVDEPLISTDVDQLIKLISQKQKLKLSELQSLTGIDKRNVEKWVRVLEDEGKISVEYGITGTYIVWVGDAYHTDSHAEEAHGEYSAQEQPSPAEEYDELEFPAYDAEEEAQEQPIHQDQDYESLNFPEDEEEGNEPENLLDSYLARKKRRPVSDNNELKSSILGSLDDQVESTNQLADEIADNEAEVPEPSDDDSDSVGEHEMHDVPEPDEPSDDDSDDGIRTELPEVEDEDNLMPLHTIEAPAEEDTEEPVEVPEPVDIAEPEPVGAEVRKPPRMSGFSETSSRELIHAYMEEINKEKAEIEKLGKEKERLYREKLAGLEARMEADLATLTHHVLDRQTRITQIKENVLLLPDKVDEVDKLHEQMSLLGREGKDALSRTTQMVDGYISALRQSKEAMKAKMKEGRAIIESERDKVEELERLNNSAESKMVKIRASVDVTKAQIDELGQNVQSMLSDLEEATEMKIEITDMASQLKEHLEAREQDLDTLEDDLEEIGKIEHYAMEYLTDYEKKIDELEQYVAKSEDELASVRESAEAAYMKRYLNELQSMTDAYGSELSATLREEETIEQKVARSREKLTKLVTESQELVRKLHGDDWDAPDYETVKSRVKSKSGKAKKKVQEKSKERQKLVEDVKKRRAKKGRKKKKK